MECEISARSRYVTYLLYPTRMGSVPLGLPGSRCRGILLHVAKVVPDHANGRLTSSIMKLSKGQLTLMEDKMSKSTLPHTWTPFERLSTMMEDMFPAASNVLGSWAPLVDIKETEKEFVFLAEIPGMNRENFEVELVGDTLVIRGKREEAKEDKAEGWIRRERHVGTFMRSFRLDTPVKQDMIEAQYRDGILQITVPKAEAVKTARIAIK